MTENERERLYLVIGNKIRVAREKIPMTQTALAKELKVSRASVVNIEKGRQRTTLHMLWDIAEHLGLEVAELIPRQREFTEDTKDVHLDPETVAQIEAAAKGDPATLRHLTEFIQMAKSKTQESL